MTIGRLRPRARPRELGLFLIAAASLIAGAVSLGMTERRASGLDPGGLDLGPADPGRLAVYLGALAAAHVALVLSGRRTDQVLLPTAGLLGGIGLLLMERLPQSLVEQSFAGLMLGLADLQSLWLLLALAIVAAIAVTVRSDAWLRLYKYSWAAAGIALLAATFLFGEETNGARLTLRIGPLAGQPSELLKVILVVFFAGYLSAYRPILAGESSRLGPVRVPPLPFLAPMGAMLGIALLVVVVQRDLGAALLFYAVFLLLFAVATSRWGTVLLGVALFVAGAGAMVGLFAHIRTRVEIWLDPFADPTGAGYQVVQGLYALGRGGLFGTGLGAGLPTVAGRPPIPAIHTDFPFVALGEELGLVGLLAILGLYLVIVERGLRIAASAADDFRALLAAGLAFVVGVQAFIIAAGNLKLIPLTGITLPFVSYGGSSLLANAIVIGLLLALSDRGVAPPPPGEASR